MRISWPIIAMLALLPPWVAMAESLSLSGTELSGRHWTQEQPVTVEAFSGSKLLVAFWRSDCAPCREEMESMPGIARTHPNLPIALVALQDAEEIRSYLPGSFPPNMHIIVVQANRAQTLRNFGDTQMALPFSTALHADGSICSQHYGVLGTEMADQWARTC